jgi:hypothetical protein
VRVHVDELVTQADIARMLNVQRQRAVQLVAREDFPAPVGKIGRSRVWRRGDVETWAVDRHRPPGRPRKEESDAG